MPDSQDPAKPRYRDYELYPFQAEAIAAVEADRSVIVSAPTGAGKTVIAEYAIDRSLKLGQRIVYTSPVKALSNQKYRDFQGRYGELIGIMTGDVTINPEAPVQIMTTEIFRNTIFENIERVRGISYVIMDEIHYISDTDRGTVWEESIIFAPKGIRFLGLSATISNLVEFRDWVAKVREEPVELVRTDERPVPLLHHAFHPEYGVVRISELKRLAPAGRKQRTSRVRVQANVIDHLLHEKLLPALYFCFSRKECEARARAHARRRLLDGAETAKVLVAFDELCNRYEVHEHRGALELRELAGRGILFHHAGMLPIYKDIVERLFTTGMVKLLFTTETFALGVNMPARAVVFSSLRKFDGVGFDYLPTLNYYQMAGRAGRQGLDHEGNVFSVFDPAVDTPKDIRNVVFGRVAPLESRFNLSYSAVLNLYALLKKDVFSAADRSFAAFQRGGKPGKDRAVLRARLLVLEKHGYIEGGELTGKGRIAAKINGYEIQLTELFWAGCFEGLPPDEISALVAAILFEARRGEFHQRMDGGGEGSYRNRAKKRIQEFRRSERALGIEEGIKELDFGMTAVMKAWMAGSSFEDLHNYTSAQEGDLVRNFRMTVQMLRQFSIAVKADAGMHTQVLEALKRINRAEVDAERQLRVS